MTSSRPPSGMVFFPSAEESDKSASLTNKQKMQQKMQKQRQLSLDRQRNVAKSTFAVGVKAQELPPSQDHGYDRGLNLPCMAKVETSPTKAPDSDKQESSVNELKSPAAALRGGYTQAADQSQELARPKTGNSVFSSVELLSNDGDGRPGFERCGGRATAEQQGVAKKSDAATWDLSVNVTAKAVAPPPVAEQDSSGNGENGKNGKKWWKPSILSRGNRNSSASASPAPETRAGNNGGEALENVAVIDRSNVRTPDSVDRTFHGPNRRAPVMDSPGRRKPPLPERRGPCVDVMPGAIFDMDAVEDAPAPAQEACQAHPQPTSGGSAAAGSSSVPARQPSEPKDEGSKPPDLKKLQSLLELTKEMGMPTTEIEAQIKKAKEQPVSNDLVTVSTKLKAAESHHVIDASPPAGVAFCGVSAFKRGPSPSPPPMDTEAPAQVRSFQADHVDRVETFGSNLIPKAPPYEVSLSPGLGGGAVGAEKRGGRRGWKPMKAQETNTGGEVPRHDTAGGTTDVCAFSFDD